MFRIFGLVRLMVAVSLLALLATFATVMPALADGYYQSFSATNYIAASTQLTSFPTNSAGTNGLNRLTGGAISMAGVEHAAFVFTSQPVNNDLTNSMITRLVRGYSSSTPILTADTNNGSLAAFPQWETLPSLTLIYSHNGTNSTTWMTNLDFYIQGCSYIGVYSQSNGQGVALTNYDIGITKKRVPITFP
jgi:hypothetical protein